jgi:hypothetical protein
MIDKRSSGFPKSRKEDRQEGEAPFGGEDRRVSEVDGSLHTGG